MKSFFFWVLSGWAWDERKSTSVRVFVPPCSYTPALEHFARFIYIFFSSQTALSFSIKERIGKSWFYFFLLNLSPDLFRSGDRSPDREIGLQGGKSHVWCHRKNGMDVLWTSLWELYEAGSFTLISDLNHLYKKSLVMDDFCTFLSSSQRCSDYTVASNVKVWRCKPGFDDVLLGESSQST